MGGPLPPAPTHEHISTMKRKLSYGHVWHSHDKIENKGLYINVQLLSLSSGNIAFSFRAEQFIINCPNQSLGFFFSHQVLAMRDRWQTTDITHCLEHSLQPAMAAKAYHWCFTGNAARKATLPIQCHGLHEWEDKDTLPWSRLERKSESCVKRGACPRRETSSKPDLQPHGCLSNL